MKTKPKRSTGIRPPEECRVRLRIICISPPSPEEYGAAFGLQDNSTTKEWILHPGKRYPNGDVHFACECRVRRNLTGAHSQLKSIQLRSCLFAGFSV